MSRETGEHRYWVVEHADKQTCHAVIANAVPTGVTLLYTDEWSGYRDCHADHHTVCHSVREWARDDDGDGIREVYCNTCEGAGSGLRTFLRSFRGVHKYYLAEYVATFETMYNAKAITPLVIQRMCFGQRLSHAKAA